MNKHELILAVRKDAGISRNKARIVVETFFEVVAEALTRGDRVEIRGLWSFSIKDYAPYTGRNPMTGQPVAVGPKRLPYFKCGRELSRRLSD